MDPIEVLRERESELEALVAEDQARLDECRSLLARLSGTQPGDEEEGDAGGEHDASAAPSKNGTHRGKARARVARAKTAPAAGSEREANGLHPKTAARLERQRAVLRYVADHEPAASGEIRKAVEIPAGSFAALMDSPWWERAGRNPQDPWRLTAAGRAELEAAAASD